MLRNRPAHLELLKPASGSFPGTPLAEESSQVRRIPLKPEEIVREGLGQLAPLYYYPVHRWIKTRQLLAEPAFRDTLDRIFEKDDRGDYRNKEELAGVAALVPKGSREAGFMEVLENDYRLITGKG